MQRTGKFEVVKEFTLSYPPERTPSGGWLFKGWRTVRPGEVIEITQAYVDGYGSDAVPEQEARLADGTIGRIGQGVTARDGYLRPVQQNCAGSGAPWEARDDGQPICPACHLRWPALGMKRKPTPRSGRKTVPTHPQEG